MSKRRPAFNPNQLSFDLPVTSPVEADGALYGLERRVSSAVGTILNGSGRSRYDISSGVSRLLDDEVTKFMLDAYASEAREDHNISFGKFLALIAETGSYGVLRDLIREIGADIMVGEEILTAELGHLDRQEQMIKARKAELRKIAPLLPHGKPKVVK